MPKDAEFKIALKKFRRSLEETINERALRIGEEKSKEIAEKFRDLAKQNLNNAQPASGSEGLISKIQESIEVNSSMRSLTKAVRGSKQAKGYIVHIPIDKEGLVMFLEYGTGLKGKYNPHPESVEAKVDGFKVGWNYAVHLNDSRPITFRNQYGKKVTMNVPYYIKKYGKTGFVFKKKAGKYIDREDLIFPIVKKVQYNWVKGYTRKNGTRVKPYTRKSNKERIITSKSEYVLSEGIKPVRFIYDAKQEVRRLINEGKI